MQTGFNFSLDWSLNQFQLGISMRSSRYPIGNIWIIIQRKRPGICSLTVAVSLEYMIPCARCSLGKLFNRTWVFKMQCLLQYWIMCVWLFSEDCFFSRPEKLSWLLVVCLYISLWNKKLSLNYSMQLWIWRKMNPKGDRLCVNNVSWHRWFLYFFYSHHAMHNSVKNDYPRPFQSNCRKNFRNSASMNKVIHSPPWIDHLFNLMEI